MRELFIETGNLLPNKHTAPAQMQLSTFKKSGYTIKQLGSQEYDDNNNGRKNKPKQKTDMNYYLQND